MSRQAGQMDSKAVEAISFGLEDKKHKREESCGRREVIGLRPWPFSTATRLFFAPLGGNPAVHAGKRTLCRGSIRGSLSLEVNTWAKKERCPHTQ